VVYHSTYSSKHLLTDRTVKQWKPDQTRRLEISDAGSKNLYLHIQPSGAKSWVMLLTRPNGKLGKLQLGPVDLSGREALPTPEIGMPLTLADAHWLTAKLREQNRRHVDVIADRKADKLRHRTAAADRAANTFGAVVREFFIQYRPRSGMLALAAGVRMPALWDCSIRPTAIPAKVTPEVVKGGLAETWADKPITDIDKYAVDAVVDEARKPKIGKARKMYSALSVLFNWLPLKYRVEVNPMIGTKSKPTPPGRRPRRLDKAEIVIFWKACDNIDEVFGALYKMLLLTGTRLREPAKMTRDRIPRQWCLGNPHHPYQKSFAVSGAAPATGSQDHRERAAAETRYRTQQPARAN